jgi:Spy/CpxP family protein refolding chaperone
MSMLKKTATLMAALVLGGTASIGVAACGEEDRPGEVKFEGGTETSTTGTSTTGTTEGTGTTGTETSP